MEINWQIGDKVRIPVLGYFGVVRSIWIVARGIQIEVRYFHNGDAKEVYFYESELEKVD